MKRPALFLTACALVGSALNLSAAFTLFDSFNYAPGSQLTGQGPAGNLWNQTVGSPTGMVVNASSSVTGGPSGPSASWRALGPTGQVIPNASTAATVFWQFVLGSATGNNWNFVVTDVNPTDTAGTSEVQFNFDNGSGAFFRARNAGAFLGLSLDGTPAGNVQQIAGVTYNVWFEIDNSIDRYRVYMQSDTVPGLASRTQVLANNGTGGLFTFRNSGAGAVANDLINVNFGPGSGQTAQTFWDNVYVDTAGFNAVNPVPEPSTWAMMAGGAAILLAVRRRRKS